MAYTISEANLERQHVLAVFLRPHTIHSLKNIDILPGSRVLDVGCGMGETTNLLANYYKGIHITGLDQDKALLEIAKSKPKTENSTIEYLEGNAIQLPFDDNHFDFVFSRFLLMHVPDALTTLKEFYRVCKKGGFLFSQEPDICSFPSYPDILGFEKLREWMVRLFRDAYIGRKLVSYSGMVGLQNIQHYVGVTYDVDDNNFKKLGWMTGQALGEALITNKVLTELEHQKHVDEMIRFQKEPGTSLLSFPVYAVWGTKK